VARGLQPATPPEATALGSIARYLAAPQEDFQPANITFGLMTGAPAEVLAVRDKKERRRAQTRHALEALERWREALA